MLTLPIQPKDALDLIIAPALQLCGPRMDSMEAEGLILAILIQESDLAHREQVGGPAHGLPQFEKSGISGVLRHASSGSFANRICIERGVHPSVGDVYEAFTHDDILAVCFARLLLWTDPQQLPPLGDIDDAWDYYVRNWRPGAVMGSPEGAAKHRERWTVSYETALNALD